MRSITIQQFLCSLLFDDQSSAEQEEEKLKWWRKIEQFEFFFWCFSYLIVKRGNNY